MTDIEEAHITFTKSKVTAAWTAKEGLSILQLAEKAGLKPDFGCRESTYLAFVTTAVQRSTYEIARDFDSWYRTYAGSHYQLGSSGCWIVKTDMKSQAAQCAELVK